MPHSPEDPGRDIPETLLTASQFTKLSDTLETLVSLILPLHQLLEAQEGLEDGVTSRLEEIMRTLAVIAMSLQASAEGLTRLTGSEAWSPALEAALNKIEARQLRQNHQIAAIDQRVQMLIDWMGAPLQGEAAQNS